MSVIVSVGVALGGILGLSWIAWRMHLTQWYSIIPLIIVGGTLIVVCVSALSKSP